MIIFAAKIETLNGIVLNFFNENYSHRQWKEMLTAG
jgi:hypothetical protein